LYPRLARVRQYIEENYQDPNVGLAEVACVAALEKTYFCRFFHQKVGIPFTCWLARERVNYALRDLMSKEQSIADLAYAVGFADVRTFQRSFKKFAGTTPAACRKAVRQQQRASGSLTDICWEEILPPLSQPVDCSEHVDRVEYIGGPELFADSESVNDLGLVRHSKAANSNAAAGDLETVNGLEHANDFHFANDFHSADGLDAAD
jgi:AraC-like DNA-binding protein